MHYVNKIYKDPLPQVVVKSLFTNKKNSNVTQRSNRIFNKGWSSKSLLSLRNGDKRYQTIDKSADKSLMQNRTNYYKTRIKNNLSLDISNRKDNLLVSHPYMNTNKAFRSNVKPPLGGGGCAQLMYKFKSRIFKTPSNKSQELHIQMKKIKKRRKLISKSISDKRAIGNMKQNLNSVYYDTKKTDLSDSIQIIRADEDNPLSIFTPKIVCSKQPYRSQLSIKKKKKIRVKRERSKIFEDECNIEIAKFKISIFHKNKRKNDK